MKWSRDTVLPFLVALIVVNAVVAWAAWSQALWDMERVARWQSLMGLVQSLLLFDTLLGVLLYTAAAQAQATVSQEQLAHAVEQATIANRPCVVLDRVETPPQGPHGGPGWKFVARNIGPGLAINAVHVEDLDASDLVLTHLGALAAGDSIDIPAAIDARLRHDEGDPIGRRRHVILAQPLGRDVWIATGNLMRENSRIFHRVQTLNLTDAQLRQIDIDTPDEYIHEHWAEIRADLDRMSQQLMQDVQDPAH